MIIFSMPNLRQEDAEYQRSFPPQNGRGIGGVLDIFFSRSCYASVMDSPLSLSGRKWVLAREQAFDSAEELVKLLASERGLADIGATASAKLSSPMLFVEMGRAVDRIRSAMQAGETIAIFGDYDADGITGTAQLVRYFRRHGLEPLMYLPHRMREGYGMKVSSIDHLHAKGATLIITVDTGIASHTEIAHAQSLGIDIIVTDHHHPSGGRPDAFAVIHPLVPDAFPNPDLSGSGVAFMLVRALENDASWPGIQEDFVLATIGTIADMVPLVGENRVLVMHGLKFLRSLPEGPLKTFADSLRSKSANLSATDIAFRLVPRINASGRMDDPAIALDALLNGGDSIGQLNTLNTERQALTIELFEFAGRIIDPSQLFLCCAHESFTAGLVGLIAGKLTQAYGKPSLVAAINGDICMASLRSIPQCNLMDILHSPFVSSLLLTFGGHSQAAGCTFKRSDLLTLTQALSAALAERGFTSEHFTPTIRLDAALQADQLSPSFVRAIRSLEPFGQANEEPFFLLTRQKISQLRTVGSGSKHLQARVGSFKSIGFHMGHHLEHLTQADHVDIACRLGIDSWSGREEVQIMVEDIRAAH